MIYIGKVRPSIMEPPIDKSIIQFFQNIHRLKLMFLIILKNRRN